MKKKQRKKIKKTKEQPHPFHNFKERAKKPLIGVMLEQLDLVIFKPMSLFKKVAKEKEEYIFDYLFFMGILYAALSTISNIYVIRHTFGSIILPAVMFLFIFAWIFIILVPFIDATIMHIFVILFTKKHKPYLETLKASVYGLTPYFLLGWITFLGMQNLIWMIILLVYIVILKAIGISKLQNTGIAKAFAIVTVPIDLILVIILIIAATMTGIPLIQ